jgi:hypothetical protein
MTAEAPGRTPFLPLVDMNTFLTVEFQYAAQKMET